MVQRKAAVIVYLEVSSYCCLPCGICKDKLTAHLNSKQFTFACLRTHHKTNSSCLHEAFTAILAFEMAIAQMFITNIDIFHHLNLDLCEQFQL